MPSLDLSAETLTILVFLGAVLGGTALSLWLAKASEPARFLISDLPRFADSAVEARLMNKEGA